MASVATFAKTSTLTLTAYHVLANVATKPLILIRKMRPQTTDPFDDSDTQQPTRLAVAVAMNMSLVLLGATVLATAFYWLDQEDMRLVYNPWTYVVLVPFALLLISTVLKMLVSRVVERSMQVAFLLSVLMHLVVINYAGSTVILSRTWPDFFDSVDQERRKQKLDALRARQYIHLTHKNQPNQRPNHLRYVPTEHQPTPDPKRQSENDSADHVSENISVSLPLIDPTASDSSAQPKTADQLVNSAPVKNSNHADSLTLETSEPATIPKSQPEQQPKLDQPIPTDPPQLEQPIDLALQPGDSTSQRQTDTTNTLSTPEHAAANLIADRASIQRSANSAPLVRSETSQPVIEPTQGAVPYPLNRSAAGGQPGPSAASSLPRYGQESLAAPSANGQSLSASNLANHQRSTTSRPTPMPNDSASMQSPTWQDIPRWTSGATGRSPSQLAQQFGSGDAATEDLAGLVGSGTAIERTNVGPARPTKGTVQLQTSEVESRADQPAIEAQPSDLVRSTRSSVTSPRIDTLQPTPGTGPSDALRPNASSGLARAPARTSSATGENTSDALASLPADFESRYLARSNVGSNRAPGSSTPVAKPAFQQRLDRLQNPEQRASQLPPETDQAIERGLEFLAKYQRPDGSWRLQDFDTEVLIRSDTAATGLALLAFQGAGYTHLQSRYAAVLDRAIGFLAQHQKPDGDLYIPQDPASDQNAWLYSHSIAALALSEAYGMTQDERLRPIAQKAIDFTVNSQDTRRGGWRYRPNVGSDTSVTGWFMMALHSGRLAGLRVPAETFDNIQKFADQARAGGNTPHLYRYNPYAADTPEQRHGLRPTAVMTSVGLLIRLYSGWPRERTEMVGGADFLLQHLPSHGNSAQSLRDTYYWYYATQVIFQMGGSHWQRWRVSLYPLLIESQISEGPWAGSWAPYQPVPDLWSRYGGRLYVTTMNLLSLEVSYRHLPLYETTTDDREGF